MDKMNFSPNGQYSIKFDFQFEVGMGGPGIGVVCVNDIKINAMLMNSWLWSEDSESLLLLEYMSRAPDKTRVCVYKPIQKHLIRYDLEFGFTLPSASFDGYELKFQNSKWGSIYLNTNNQLDLREQP